MSRLLLDVQTAALEWKRGMADHIKKLHWCQWARESFDLHTLVASVFIILSISGATFAAPKLVRRHPKIHTLYRLQWCVLCPYQWMEQAHSAGTALGRYELCPRQLSRYIRRLGIHPLSLLIPSVTNTLTLTLCVQFLPHSLYLDCVTLSNIWPLIQYSDHLSTLYFKLHILNHPVSWDKAEAPCEQYQFNYSRSTVG